MNLKTILLFMGLYCCVTPLRAQSIADTLTAIEHIFSRYQPAAPGGQLAISRQGKIIFSKHWGMADLEQQREMSSTSILEAGSVSKQFTAAAILLLAQQGKLKISDEVHRYLPELPDYGVGISISQMLHHTSGLKDWGSLVALSDWPRGTKVYTNTEVLNIMSRQDDLNHQPGREFMYSNSNYVLLAIIVERVSGLTFSEFTRQHIFGPAGMNHSSWRTDIRTIVPRRATAYSKNDQGYFTDMPNENVYGNGGLLTTAEDLLKWNEFYLSGKLGGPALLASQLEVLPLSSGAPNNYAAGLRVSNVEGQQVISHDGATVAYRALLEYYPALKLSIAWLSNTSEFDNKDDSTSALRDLLLNKALAAGKGNEIPRASSAPSATREEKPPVLTVKELEAYTGKYYSKQVESGLELSISSGKIVVTRYSGDKFTLIPTGRDEFLIADSKVKVSFERKNNMVSGLRFSTPRVRNVAFARLVG
jgi:CubicO group peptidase (beta-lactamase class C family)